MATTDSAVPLTTPRRVRIHVSGRVFDATLRDNPSARSLVDQLPLTVPFTDYAGQEKTAPLPRPLTMTGMPAGDDAKSLDIGYYAPGGVLVLYYTDVAYYRGIARLGHVHASVDDLKDIPDGAIAVAVQPRRKLRSRRGPARRWRLHRAVKP